MGRHAVPGVEPGVVDALLRVLSAIDNVVRKVVADFSVFNVQFSYALLVTLEKQVYDFFIVYHLTASFPASPIYYGFGGACYIKSRIS